MELGLTIAPITKNAICIQNYRNFGDKYWDDGQHNKSKVGYYFAYYNQKNCVEFRQIVKIMKPSVKPKEMEHWTTTRNILCLGPLLKKIPWDDWIKNEGYGSPYSNNYGSINTGSWTYENLRTKFPEFKFDALIQAMNKEALKQRTPILMIPLKDPLKDPPREPPPKVTPPPPTPIKETELVRHMYELEYETRMKEMEQKLREECEQKIKEATIKIEHELKIKIITDKFNEEIQKANEEKDKELNEIKKAY